MNSYLIKIGCIFLLCLSGCDVKNKNDCSPSMIDACLSICTKHFQTCIQSCGNDCLSCSVDSAAKSHLGFIKYLNEQNVQGGFVMRRLKSYRDPLQCRKISRNCQSDLITCKQSCTGVIHKKLRSVPYCT